MNSNISCEANEANCLNANKNPGQNNTNATRQLENEPIESVTPKHRAPCPFLRKKGHCLKDSHCDFLHDIVPKHLTQNQRRRKFHPSFHKQKLDPLPPMMKFSSSYPYPQPLMNIPTNLFAITRGTDYQSSKPWYRFYVNYDNLIKVLITETSKVPHFPRRLLYLTFCY